MSIEFDVLESHEPKDLAHKLLYYAREAKQSLLLVSGEMYVLAQAPEIANKFWSELDRKVSENG